MFMKYLIDCSSIDSSSIFQIDTNMKKSECKDFTYVKVFFDSNEQIYHTIKRRRPSK